MLKPALLALEDGSLFWGRSIGFEGSSLGELVFNTSMTGYQEILTDPSYANQLVTLTYPHIGNTGCTPIDVESAKVFAAALIIRDLPIRSSSWRARSNLSDFLIENQVVAIADIDTRKLTRLLSTQGAQKAALLTGDSISADDAIIKARSFPGLAGMDLAKQVSTTHAYEACEHSWDLASDTYPKSTGRKKFHVVTLDFGVKRNILRLMNDLDCRVTVVPAKTSASEIMALKPDGVFLSNGPGDPEPCDYAISTIQTLLADNVPLFGICLGYQLLALACGAKTEKMKYGHHGANHPVLDIASGRVMITSQNHGFTVSKDTLPSRLKLTHRSLFDNSLQGFSVIDADAYGFQGHPEASPGPHDIIDLFQPFISMMAARTTEN